MIVTNMVKYDREQVYETVFLMYLNRILIF